MRRTDDWLDLDVVDKGSQNVPGQKKKTKIRGATAAALRPVRQHITNGKPTLKHVAVIVKRPGKVILPGGGGQVPLSLGLLRAPWRNP